jgi:hypothetical protein
VASVRAVKLNGQGSMFHGSAYPLVLMQRRS